MSETTYVVIGGGYAGIHTVKALQKSVIRKHKKQDVRILLIDPKPSHLKKVLLFKPATEKMDISIPWKRIFPDSVEFIQGSVIQINHKNKRISYQDSLGERLNINYDIAVVAVGSVIRKASANQGGIPLSSPEDARLIRKRWHENLQKAVHVEDVQEQNRLMTVAIAGAGISGIETSAALVEKMKTDASKFGLEPSNIQVLLINSKNQLFEEGSQKASRKLEQLLNQMGITIIHHARAVKENGGVLELDNGQKLPIGLCVWTLGLRPNPVLSTWGLPVNEEGKIHVDESYRVIGTEGIYSIGDCARIFDPKSGQEDTMTCKEATIQAKRLGKVIHADLNYRIAPIHKTPVTTTYCFGLGEKRGLVWLKFSKLNLIFTGKLGLFIRKVTWNIASLVK